MKIQPIFVIVAVVLFLSAPPVFGWSKDDEETCLKSEVGPDEKISVCTRLLQDPEFPQSSRIWAHKSRGHGYLAKGDRGNAQADFKKFGDLQTMEQYGGSGDHGELSVPPELDGVGLAFKGAVAASYHGRAFNFKPGGQLYIGGIGERLLACNLPADMGERMRLSVFVNSVAQGAALRGGATYLAGGEFAQKLDCSSPVAAHLASGLAKTLEANERGPRASQRAPEAANGAGPGDGLTPFLRTCVPKYSAGQCLCLARLAQGIIPDIHQMDYHRDIIVRIVQSNPIVATQIGTVCQISNY